ncbi:2-C-methyl-D-erythritol 4-phosphate cytidylyltransferase [bacterium]|nr:MAG: 2-C-methyl-D-erythritol 4-phosphate cytidylyltransferase [bacterium]
MKPQAVEAIIPAAGRGERLNSKVPKPLVRIDSKPILAYCLEALAGNKSISRIVIAVSEENREAFNAALRKFRLLKRVSLVSGGESRQESVAHCLGELGRDTGFVLIHDAARPFLSGRLVADCLKEARISGAVVCGLPARATMKRVESGWVKETLKREDIWEIQTPQVFRKDMLLKAYAKFKNISATDDASLVERLGVKVKVIKGSYYNIKITTPEDLVFAKAIAKQADV